MRSYGQRTIYLGDEYRKPRKPLREIRYSTHQSTGRKALDMVERERTSRSLRAEQQRLFAQISRELMAQTDPAAAT